MYAIVVNGSRQHRAEPGGTLLLDYKDVAVGAAIDLDEVLLVSDGGDLKVGQPRVVGAKVVTEVVGLETKKTVIQKFRRRKNYRRLKGHTQTYLRVKVKDIVKG